MDEYQSAVTLLEDFPEDFTRGVINEGNPPNSALSKLYEIQKKVEQRSTQEITFDNPILRLNEIPLIYPRSINSIQGRYGSHKTRFAEHLASTLIKTQTAPSILNLQSDQTKQFSVIYIDTERDLKNQYPEALKIVKQNAGLDSKHECRNLNFFSFLQFRRHERLGLLKDLIDQHRSETSNHIVVFLDVITDLIKDFNRVSQCLELIDFLNSLINDYDFSVVGIIHENPSGETKARGHIGTELINKSTTSISIGYVDEESDMIKVKFIKCRNTKRSSPLLCKYDSNQKKIILATEAEILLNETSFQKAPINAVLNQIYDILSKGSESQKNLIFKLCKKNDASERTIKSRLEFIEAQNLMVGLEYDLVKTHGNKFNQNIYSLKKRESKIE